MSEDASRIESMESQPKEDRMSNNLELVLRENSHSLPAAVLQSDGDRISIMHNGTSPEDIRDLLIKYLYWIQDCINEGDQ